MLLTALPHAITHAIAIRLYSVLKTQLGSTFDKLFMHNTVQWDVQKHLSANIYPAAAGAIIRARSICV